VPRLSPGPIRDGFGTVAGSCGEGFVTPLDLCDDGGRRGSADRSHLARGTNERHFDRGG
jgi:hypothetical protein